MKSMPYQIRTHLIASCLLALSLGLLTTGCLSIDAVVPYHANVGDKVAIRDYDLFIPLGTELFAEFGDTRSSSVFMHDERQLVVTVPEGLHGNTEVSIWSNGSLISSPAPFRVDTVPIDVRILAYGDSLIMDSYHPKTLDTMLNADGIQALVINEGWSGETLQGGAMRIETILSIHDGVDYMYIIEGTNDVTDQNNTPISEMLTSLDQMIGIAQDAEISVLLTTVPPRTGPSLLKDQTSPTVEEWNAELLTYAGTNGIQVLDLYAVFMADPDWESLLHEDGIHFTKRGWDLVAAELYSVYSPLLQ